MLKQSLITGDFFISPSRTVLDLEASLKDVPCNEVCQRIERFFVSRQPHTMGLSGGDFAVAFSSALEKIEYPKLGISLEEANYLFTVNGSLKDILKSPSVLLLPYCAKLVECEYRNNGGCSKCGECSMGAAYELAENHGLKPITIQNYRHLRTTLQSCKKAGVKSYIGCCCEAFFSRRQRIFKEAEIPGVLIDIESSTCYDLDREVDGLAGEFENQTHLKLDLLKKLIDHVA
jgi:lipoate-protein ligase A